MQAPVAEYCVPKNCVVRVNTSRFHPLARFAEPSRRSGTYRRCGRVVVQCKASLAPRPSYHHKLLSRFHFPRLVVLTYPALCPLHDHVTPTTAFAAQFGMRIFRSVMLWYGPGLLPFCGCPSQCTLKTVKTGTGNPEYMNYFYGIHRSKTSVRPCAASPKHIIRDN